MSEPLEQQAEELEALTSIYEGDLYFKQLNSTTFQYKYGEENEANSFNVEVLWTEEYPNTLPKINLDTYFNRSLSSEFKTKIIEILKEEGETWIGCGMTYTLFECLKEKLTDLQTELEEESKNVKVASVTQNMSAIQLEKPSNQSSAPAAKKEQLTKAQKRKLWTRSDHHGNKPRGWDWVDIVKHLAQTGGKDEATPSFNAQQPLTSTAH